MMGFQDILVTCLFILALAYIGRMIYRMITTKKSCGQNCKCGVDFSDIEINKSSKK